MSRWWKCDLQVATPNAKDFKGPSSGDWVLDAPDGRMAAAKRYMQSARDAGLEVLVLADHNDASWTSLMVAAGRERGITVFPGVEITTGSGSDGVHLIVFTDPAKSEAEVDWILSGPCGFGPEHPRFDPSTKNPASAPRTMQQILDALPSDYLAIAPHAFNDNGIASEKTAKGDVRWKALHHPRLAAIDVGDVRTIENRDSFHGRFARRELSNFPCLPDLAFISTSDAYSIESLGRRFTWIRMAEPSLEGLRQAFLDHEARIRCDWHPSLVGDLTPNDIRHSWVEEIELDGLSTTSGPVKVSFDPRLTVVIGGRGSGKSTIVAGLRCLYGESESLPPQAQAELTSLLNEVFAGGNVKGRHHLPYSGEAQRARWTSDDGSRRSPLNESEIEASDSMPTDFKVRVINQKELFERAAHRADDPHATSRNLLALVDDALAASSRSDGAPGFSSRLEELQTEWIAASREHQLELDAAQRIAAVRIRVSELETQVAAFDNEETVSRRHRNDSRIARSEWLERHARSARAELLKLNEEVATHLSRVAAPPSAAPGVEPELPEQGFENIVAAIEKIRTDLREQLREALDTAERALEEVDERRAAGGWQTAVAEARADAAAYRAELETLGLDPEAYDRVRSQLESEKATLVQLEARLSSLPNLEARASDRWSAISALLDERRESRTALLDEVGLKSGLLRFATSPRTDTGLWTEQVRELLNLRADGFLADVPALAAWLWDPSAEDSAERQQKWRNACVTGNFEELASSASLRPSWQQRLAGLDAVLRARLASLLAEDTVSVEFLREGGDPDTPGDWKALTSGSPGQRSAAMLSFVLHHGTEPLVLDQPEDDLDTEWITELVVTQLRQSRQSRQIIVITHNANIPVNADAERVLVMENDAGGIRIRSTDGAEHSGPIEDRNVRADIQQIMEGGVRAFVRRERRYNNELDTFRAAMQALDNVRPRA